MSIVVIGAGPAGMMAAIAAARRGCDVLLIEKNDRPGRKMYISGKGRCNITNDTDIPGFLKEVVSNPKFLMSALSAFSPYDTVNFFEQRGLPMKTERGGRVFPVSDKSADVIDCLVREVKASGVLLHTSETVVRLEEKDGRIVRVITDKGSYDADAVVIACGGLSYPKTGSTGDGYAFARALGHTIKDPKPALCPILLSGAVDAAGNTISREQLPFPEGLSLKNIEARILLQGGSALFCEFGEMLFTEKGVSGPAVLSLSSRINRLEPKSLLFAIDFKPALDIKTLDARILRDFGQNANKQFKNSLNELLPKSAIPFIIALSRIDPEKPVNLIQREERKGLVGLLKGLKMPVGDLGSINEAIVTAGGVNVREVNPATMRSKLVENLYFAGEVLDVDALTGGYNMQIAMSTGYLAGMKLECQNNIEEQNGGNCDVDNSH
jgi:predicted Rossmann fold flavoprotein